MELLRHTSCVLSVHRSSSKEEALFDETVGHIQDILLGGWVGGWWEGGIPYSIVLGSCYSGCV